MTRVEQLLIAGEKLRAALEAAEQHTVICLIGGDDGPCKCAEGVRRREALAAWDAALTSGQDGEVGE